MKRLVLALSAAVLSLSASAYGPYPYYYDPCWCLPPPCDPCLAPVPVRQVARAPAEFHTTVLFATGSYALDDEAKAALDAAAKALKMFGEELVLIEGHTDSVGSADSNQILSLRRAIAASDYLRKQGVLAGRISMEGFGESRPVADNRTAAGRRLNRRVEVSVGGAP